MSVETAAAAAENSDNLTREQAAARARLLRVTSYDVDLDLTSSETTFRSRTLIRFACTEPGAGTFLELTAPTVHVLRLNGRDLDVDAAFDGYRIALSDLAEANEVEVVADCAYSRTGEGLHRFVDPVDGEAYLYSQFETNDAHRMYACFDQPDLKAVFRLTVTTPEHWTAISNSPADSEIIESGVASESASDSASDSRLRRRRRWVFAETPVMSTYITALVAGPYSRVSDVHDGIEMSLYCRRSLAEFLDPDEIFDITKAGFDFYHRVFDYRYPFGKYDQLFVPEFNAGAMENAGCVTFLEDYVFRSKVTDSRRERRAETILHEMAHMWFGDLVTMRWWDDLWLNESFATYASVLAQTNATRWTSAWTTFCNAEKTWALRQDQLPSTHPIVADARDMEAVKTNFDGITYAKGASVLKQLVAWVGQEEFLAGLRSYFRRFEYGNTSLRDLLDELEVSSGRTLGPWAKEWLETTGVNTLRPSFAVDDSAAFTSFAVVQEPASVPTGVSKNLRSHRVAIGLYDRTGDGALVRRDRVELDVTGAATDVPKLVGVRKPDLVLLNDDDLTYAKIRLDDESLAAVIDGIGSIRGSLPRALCWSAAWDMTRDAEMPARDYVRLVLSGIESETDIGVVQSLLAKASLAMSSYGEPSNRTAALRTLTERAYELMRSAEPGSDVQLVYAQVFAAAEDADQLDHVRALYDERETVTGLTLDTELRWHFLIELAAHGRADTGDIDAQLERDRTAAGEKRAASARAALPTPEAKAAAWSAVVDSDELSNHMQLATMRTFWMPEQAELCSPYAERFFATVADLWRSRSNEIAQTFTEVMYPSVLIEQETVDRTDRYLAEENPQPALRRALVEGRDTVARALRARTRDAEAATS